MPTLFMISFLMNLATAYYFAVQPQYVDSVLQATAVVFSIFGTIVFIALLIARIMEEFKKGDTL